jgi:glutaredoxin
MIVFSIKNCSFCDKLKALLDKASYEYKSIDVHSENGAREFKKITKVTNTHDIPVVLVSNKILAPGHSFKTIDECFNLIQELKE